MSFGFVLICSDHAIKTNQTKESVVKLRIVSRLSESLNIYYLTD